MALFTEHDCLAVEPTALVEIAAELDAVDAVLLDRVFIVNAGDETFVADEESAMPGGFVKCRGSWLQ